MLCVVAVVCNGGGVLVHLHSGGVISDHVHGLGGYIVIIGIHNAVLAVELISQGYD